MVRERGCGLFNQEKGFEGESPRERTVDAKVRGGDNTGIARSADVFRVRDGKERQSEENFFVFRFVGRGDAGGFVSIVR